MKIAGCSVLLNSIFPSDGSLCAQSILVSAWCKLVRPNLTYNDLFVTLAAWIVFHFTLQGKWQRLLIWILTKSAKVDVCLKKKKFCEPILSQNRKKKKDFKKVTYLFCNFCTCVLEVNCQCCCLSATCKTNSWRTGASQFACVTQNVINRSMVAKSMQRLYHHHRF